MSGTTKTGGLAGVTAGQTAICTVGKEGVGLTYRGYSIEDLASNAAFEEVAYLLLRGRLPTWQELIAYRQDLQNLRKLPEELCKALELLPAGAHPMDVLRTGCSVLGCLETENAAQQLSAADRLLATFPAMLTYWYHYTHNKKRIRTESAEETTAGHFLALLLQKSPSPTHRRVMDISLILYAEHEFNASTFTARVCASTLSDLHSAICAGIGTLRGALHGGANEAAMELIQRYKTAEEAEAGIMDALAKKEKIMGFGHRVYKHNDPRSDIIKPLAKQLAQAKGDAHIYPVSERIEAVMRREKKLFPNVDFYAAATYHFLGIPTSMFTPIFVMARTAGWAAHVFEQRADNRLIRPDADYIGPTPQPLPPIEQR